MDNLAPSMLKSILHSKRANIYYLEMCRVMQKDGRVLYLTEESKEKQYWNIPIANTTCILLGTGTSITQAAMRMLASASVLVGFSGGGGTPLIAANAVEWLSPQSEYRPTEYVQGWMSFWFDDYKRLQAAKQFQQQRIAYMQQVWGKDKDLKAEGFTLDDADISKALNRFVSSIEQCANVTQLLLIEAKLTKSLYKIAANRTKMDGFVRNHENIDDANAFLSISLRQPPRAFKDFNSLANKNVPSTSKISPSCASRETSTMVRGGYGPSPQRSCCILLTSGRC